jgi:hypothetical protein
MKLKNILALITLLMISTNAFSASIRECDMFAGSYSKQMDNNDTYNVAGVKITVKDLLEIKYNSDLTTGEWKGWIETYIVDGLSHQGDMNTGLYTVNCKSNKMTIKRAGLLKNPLITEISLDGDQLLFVQYAETAEQHATFMQLKKN